MRFFLSIALVALNFSVFAQGNILDNASKKAQSWFNQNTFDLNTLKESVVEYSANTVTDLAIENAFKNDPSLYIPLPAEYNKLKETVSRFGGTQIVSNIEAKLNEAAEQTIELAKPILKNAINQLTLQDAIKIASNNETGFTNFLDSKGNVEIMNTLKPNIKTFLENAGTYNLLNQFFKSYKKYAGFFGRKIPDAPDLDTYVAEKAVAGLFMKLGAKETEFRQEKLPAIFSK